MAARLACADIGFTSGFLLAADGDVVDLSNVRPPWRGTARCDTFETLQECLRFGFGATVACGGTMALFCSSDAASALLTQPEVLSPGVPGSYLSTAVTATLMGQLPVDHVTPGHTCPMQEVLQELKSKVHA